MGAVVVEAVDFDFFGEVDGGVPSIGVDAKEIADGLAIFPGIKAP